MINNHINTCMKNIFFVILLMVQGVCFAQKEIDPITVEMNDRKYLFFKFSSDINYAEMGSQDLSAEKCLGKILKLKAEIPYFDETNLSVVTADGKYYSFTVKYNANPSYIALDMANVKDSITSKNVIPSTGIEVSDVRVTHLILPTKVSDISIGNDEVISEKADAIDNIVKVKSAIDETEEFFETSITVVTADGNIYPMIVGYAKDPKRVNISFSEGPNALFRGVNVNDENMLKMSKWIVEQGQHISDLGREEYKMIFQLYSVYTDQDIIAFHLHAINRSRIDYPIDFVKAYIADKKEEKKTAMQEQEIYPIYSYYSNEDKVIHGKDELDIVIFYKRFTIPKKRVLYFEMFEDNGGRQIKFTASNKTIINAEVIKNLE